MPIDKVKPLKIETSGSGTEIDPFPTETNPSEDYLAAKGIAFEGTEVAVISSTNEIITLKDSEITTPITLRNLAVDGNVLFSRSGNTTPGTYLQVGAVASNAAGHFIRIPSKIIAITITCNTLAANPTRYQLRRKIALGSFVDIQNAHVDVPVGQYKAINGNLSIQLDAADEIVCIASFGSTLNSPIVTVWTIPS